MWTSHLTLDQIIRQDEENEGGEEKEKKERKEREEGGERSSTISLVFPTIEPSVFVGARGKVIPHDKSFK